MMNLFLFFFPPPLLPWNEKMAWMYANLSCFTKTSSWIRMRINWRPCLTPWRYVGRTWPRETLLLLLFWCRALQRWTRLFYTHASWCVCVCVPYLAANQHLQCLCCSLVFLCLTALMNVARPALWLCCSFPVLYYANLPISTVRKCRRIVFALQITAVCHKCCFTAAFHASRVLYASLLHLVILSCPCLMTWPILKCTICLAITFSFISV